MAKKRKGERPDKLIQLSYQVGYKPDGRPDRRYVYGKTRAEAERKRDAAKAQLNAGLSASPEITVAAWVELFKSTYRERVHPSYLSNDDVPYNRLVKELGRMRVADVREAHLQRALNKVSGMSSSTVDKYMSTIKRVFRKARKNHLISEDPSDELMRPLSVKGTHRALERWETELIMSHWDDDGVRAGLWVLLMLLCGLRRGEVIALRWENINLESRTLHVCETAVTTKNVTVIEQRAKSDAGLRTLPVCKSLEAALLTVPEEKRFGLVCLSAKGKTLTEKAFVSGFSGFVRSMERIANGEPPRQQGRRTDAEKKKLRKVQDDPSRVRVSFRAHDLRHSFATALYDAGVPVKAAQYFLGHANIKMTLDLYTHLSKEREAASHLQMVSFLDSWVELRKIEGVREAALEGQNEQ